MTEQSFVQVRIDSKLKQDATDVLNEIGMDMPNAIRMFLKRIVLERGLPFEAKLPSSLAESDDSDVPSVITIPAKPSLMLDEEEYIEMLCKVPAGQITRSDDIENYLAKVHGVERVTIHHRPIANIDGIPFWREVSTRGMLQDSAFRCTRETQKKKLEAEGLVIVPCGAYQRSLRVDHYRDFLFDFDTLDK